MNDLSAFLFVLLQLVFWLLLILIGWSWAMSRLAPKGTVRRRVMRGSFRLIFVGPFRQSYRVISWLVARLIANTRQYRSHQVYLENYPVTPLQLYAAIEVALQERQIVGVQIERIVRLEWHLLSARRIYLLIRCREVFCFISAVPLGTGLLVSWRYTAAPGRLLLTLFQIPYLGFAVEKLIRPATFYREDYHHALEHAIRLAVLEATNRLAIQQNARPLQENEARPLLREYYDA